MGILSFLKKMSEEGEEKNLSLDVTKVKPIVPPKPTSPKLNLPILSLKDNIATNEPISSPRLLLTTSEPIKSTNSKALPPEIVDVKKKKKKKKKKRGGKKKKKKKKKKK